MKALRPDEIQRDIERQKKKELRECVFFMIMLVLAPIVVMVASVLD